MTWALCKVIKPEVRILVSKKQRADKSSLEVGKDRREKSGYRCQNVAGEPLLFSSIPRYHGLQK